MSQIINITVSDEGHIHITSPLDIPMTLLALIEAQKAIVMQTIQPVPEQEVLVDELTN